MAYCAADIYGRNLLGAGLGSTKAVLEGVGREAMHETFHKTYNIAAIRPTANQSVWM